MKNLWTQRRTRIFISWLLVSFCIAAIYLIVPLARTIQKFVADHWGRSLFGYSVLVVTAAAFFVLLYILIFRLKIRAFSNYFWLSLIAILYTYFTLKLWDAPEEAIHFLEYGLLGFLLFRALRFNIKDSSIYIIAFLIGTLVGIFDEVLQWIIPDRLWDIRDVGLNSLSCGLFQVALWKGIRPKGISPKIRAQSLKTLSILLGVNVVVLGLCLSNTPQRVSAYTKIFPALSFLEKEEPMNRFRHKHKDPDIGEFDSLLNLDDLSWEDRELTLRNSRTLREWKNKSYREFRRQFHPLKYPFLYELRTHVEIRERHDQDARDVDDEYAKKELLHTVYKENLILKKYFGKTLHEASYSWEEERALQIEALIDKTVRYKSPIRFRVALPWSEKTMWMAIIIFLIALMLLHLFLIRTRKVR